MGSRVPSVTTPWSLRTPKDNRGFDPEERQMGHRVQFDTHGHFDRQQHRDRRSRRPDEAARRGTPTICGIRTTTSRRAWRRPRRPGNGGSKRRSPSSDKESSGKESLEADYGASLRRTSTSTSGLASTEDGSPPVRTVASMPARSCSTRRWNWTGKKTVVAPYDRSGGYVGPPWRNRRVGRNAISAS